MSELQTLQVQRDERGVVTLWLYRARTHNAFDARMIDELNQVLEQLAGDREMRLLVLRGRGPNFCAGADLTWMRASAALSYEENLADAHQLGELMARLYALPAPTLAVVQGAAYGGAVGLVACCDMAIGAVDAQFALSEVRIGLLPAVISPYVAQAIGPRALRRYALSGERFDGRRATELGLLAECCPADKLDDLLARWIAQLLLASPQAQRVCKALLQDVGDGERAAELRDRTEAAIAGIRTSDEGQEGLAAFMEKRSPRWQEPNP